MPLYGVRIAAGRIEAEEEEAERRRGVRFALSKKCLGNGKGC